MDDLTIASGSDWAPAACTLPTVERPLRLAEFDGLFSTSLRAVHRVGRTTADLVLDGTVADRARDLARREAECCSFFGFDLSPIAADGGCSLRVTVPPSQVRVLDALTARAAAAAGLEARA